MTNLIRIEKLSPETLNPELPALHEQYPILLFVRSGNGTLQLDHQLHTIQEGRLFYLAAGESKLDVNWTGSGWLVLFEDWLLRAFFQQHSQEKVLPLFFQGRKPYADLSTTRAVVVQSFLLLMWHELKYEKSFKIAQTYLNALLLHLTDAYRQSNHISAGPVNYEQVEKLLSLITEHFKTERLPTFYAVSLGIPVRKLNGITRKATGKLVLDLITDQLLAEAERLLIEGRLSIKEIAYELDFADMAQFSHFMSRHTGRSPKDFRLQNQPDK